MYVTIMHTTVKYIYEIFISLVIDFYFVKTFELNIIFFFFSQNNNLYEDVKY